MGRMRMDSALRVTALRRSSVRCRTAALLQPQLLVHVASAWHTEERHTPTLHMRYTRSSVLLPASALSTPVPRARCTPRGSGPASGRTPGRG